MAWVDRGCWVDNFLFFSVFVAGRCCCDYMVCQEIKKSYQLNTPYQLMPSIFTVLKMKIPSEGINLSLCAVLYLLCVNLNTDCINQYVKTVYVDYEIYCIIFCVILFKFIYMFKLTSSNVSSSLVTCPGMLLKK